MSRPRNSISLINECLAAMSKLPPERGPLAEKFTRALVVARGRIEHLEAQLAATETMRDRIAMQLLGDVLVGKLVHNGLNSHSCIEYAYQLADQVLEFRAQGAAEVLGETTSPDFSSHA